MHFFPYCAHHHHNMVIYCGLGGQKCVSNLEVDGIDDDDHLTINTTIWSQNVGQIVKVPGGGDNV